MRLTASPPHTHTVAMILAAGRGQRMRPLTDVTPKPLLPVRGKPLMQWPMEALVRGGFTQLVVNTAWLGEQISSHFGPQPLLEPRHPHAHAERLHIDYSHEGLDFGYALETAGGISRALPLLGDVFWVLAGDVFMPDFAFTSASVERFSASGKLAHLWLVPNPPHNPRGDFGLTHDGLALNQAEEKYTFSTIALYRRVLFEAPWCPIIPGNPQGTAAALAPLLRAAMDAGQVSAELYTGAWTDVGTPERLSELNAP
jgi:N-acetyl-alpha-D-muramate 1-phosphate uridylyltransferase